MSTNKNGNGGNGNDGKPARSKRITADQLNKAAEAAQEAAQAAAVAAEAVVVALESEDVEDEPQSSHAAFEAFMSKLQGIIGKAGNSVSVTEHARWIKIEGVKNGHKVYVAKGKNQVTRIESTLPPKLIPGATAAEKKNGRIASYIPATPLAVGAAIRQLVQYDEHIRPPTKSGEHAEDGGVGGSGGELRTPEYN